MPRAVWLVVPLGIAFGIWSEWAGSGFGQPRGWVPDLLTGATILTAGVVAWARRPASPVGVLLVASGLCWFSGNLADPIARATGLSAPGLAALSAVLVVSHRAPFAHAILGYPGGRLTRVVERVAVCVAYASVVAAPLLPSEATALGVTALVAGAGFVSYRRTLGRRRRAKLLSARVAIGLTVAVAAGVALRLVLGPGPGAEPAVVLYELALGGSAVLLAAGLAGPATDEAAVADMVVELGETPSARCAMPSPTSSATPVSKSAIGSEPATALSTRPDSRSRYPNRPCNDR